MVTRVGLVAQDGLDGGPRDDEGADVYLIRVDGRGHADRARHGGVRDDLPVEVGLRHLVRRIVVVEAGRTHAVNLADAEVGNAVAPETQGLLRAADEDDLPRAALECDCLCREGAEHVDDDDSAARAAGAFDEAVYEDAHGAGGSYAYQSSEWRSQHCTFGSLKRMSSSAPRIVVTLSGAMASMTALTRSSGVDAPDVTPTFSTPSSHSSCKLAGTVDEVGGNALRVGDLAEPVAVRAVGRSDDEDEIDELAELLDGELPVGRGVAEVVAHDDVVEAALDLVDDLLGVVDRKGRLGEDGDRGVVAIPGG